MRKTFLILILLARLPLSAADLKIGDEVQFSSDIRYVNNYPINLWPVRTWFRGDKTGQRPLTAWRRFELIQIKSDEGGKKVCVLKNEAGEPEQVAVLNFPPETAAYMGQINALKANVVARQAEIDAIAPEIRARNAVTPIRSADPEDNEQRKQVNLDAANLVTKRENLERAQEALKNFIAQGKVVGELFLYKTAHTWATLPVWDNGQKNH